MKISDRVKSVLFLVLFLALFFISGLFDKRLDEETSWFLMKLCVCIIGIAIILFFISEIAKGIFIKKINEKNEEEKYPTE